MQFLVSILEGKTQADNFNSYMLSWLILTCRLNKIQQIFLSIFISSYQKSQEFRKVIANTSMSNLPCLTMIQTKNIRSWYFVHFEHLFNPQTYVFLTFIRIWSNLLYFNLSSFIVLKLKLKYKLGQSYAKLTYSWVKQKYVTFGC